MNLLRLSAALIALASGTATLACEYPPLVTAPAGDEATLEEMLEAQAGIRTYVAAMEAYLACVDGELTAAGENSPEQFKSIMFSRHNVAVAEMEAVVNYFNEQIQIYQCSTSAEQDPDVALDCAETTEED